MNFLRKQKHFLLKHFPHRETANSPPFHTEELLVDVGSRVTASVAGEYAPADWNAIFTTTGNAVEGAGDALVGEIPRDLRSCPRKGERALGGECVAEETSEQS